MKLLGLGSTLGCLFFLMGWMGEWLDWLGECVGSLVATCF